MFRKSYSAPMPDDAVPVGPGLVRFRQGGEWVEAKTTADGRRILLQANGWYGKVAGKVVALGPNKKAAADELVRLKERARLAKRGLAVEVNTRTAKPLVTLVDDWHREKAAAGRHVVRLTVDRARVEKLLESTGLDLITDLQGDAASGAISDALAALRTGGEALTLPKDKKLTPGQIRAVLGVTNGALWKLAKVRGITGTGKGRAKFYTQEEARALLAGRSEGLGPNTVNGYRQAFGSFCRWLAKRGLLLRVPYLGLKADERKERRLERMAVDRATIEKLATSVESLGLVRAGMTGRSRATVYRLAFFTMLRAGALRQLVPADFHLGGEPFVRVRPAIDKTGKARDIPLPPELAKAVESLIRGLPRGRPIWPLPGSMATVLRGDLARAGIPSRVDGKVFDVHAFRHSGASHFASHGVPLDVIALTGGWASLNVFYKRYRHLAGGEAAKVLGRAW